MAQQEEIIEAVRSDFKYLLMYITKISLLENSQSSSTIDQIRGRACHELQL